MPPEKRNLFFRTFNAGYNKVEHGYARLIGGMVRHAGLMVLLALVLAGIGGWGIARLPGAFIPNEDQGYLMIGVQMPDGASLGRTGAALAEASRMAKATPGVRQVVAITGVSILDNMAQLANAGVAFVVLDDWGKRLKNKDQDLRSIAMSLQRQTASLQDGRAIILAPPPIQGIGNASGFQMQIEQRDGSFDLGKLQAATDEVIEQARTQTSIANPFTSFRAGAPHIEVEVDRSKAESMNVAVGDVFATLSSFVGSTYVNRFNKFGLSLQVYVQADAQYRAHPEDLLKLNVKSSDGKMIPIGALAQLKPARGAAIISLYNLYPSAAIVGSPAPGFSSGESLSLMDEIAAAALPPGTTYEWTAMSYQETIVGDQIVYVFGLAILLVYLCLAGQYESWIAPLGVILAVPLALSGPAIALAARRPAQQPLHPDRPDAADRARRQERHPDRRGGARGPHGRGQADRRGGGRGGRHPVAPDPDDVVRLHPRRDAAGDRDRRRRRGARLARHVRDERHDRLDLPGRAVRAVLLHGAAALRGTAERPQGAASRGRSTRGVRPSCRPR